VQLFASEPMPTEEGNMSLEKLQLNRLLKLISAPEKVLIRELKADIRAQQKKDDGDSGGGGSFYDPFWYDLKQHVAGGKNISVATQERISINARRRNLYPQLEQSFLKVWGRGSNQKIALLEAIPKGRVVLPNIGLTVKVESILPLSIEGELRLAYPYWSHKVQLDNSAIRIGLWLMDKALKNHGIEKMRLYDGFNGTYYSVNDFPMTGNEERLLLQKYQYLVERRNSLLE
jgi:hypothetical protein